MLACDPEEGGTQAVVRSSREGYRTSFDPGEFQNRHERSIDAIAAIFEELATKEDIDPPTVYELIDSDGLEWLISHHYQVAEPTGQLEVERTTDRLHLRVRCSPDSVTITIDPVDS